MSKSEAKFYYISNTCDIDGIDIAGEILVVLDCDYSPIWDYDLSDDAVDLAFAIPKELFLITNSIEYEQLGRDDTRLTEKLLKRITNYLLKNGCEEMRD